jgi:flagellum-specific peptidoglycan hydrolase FlgJ
MANQATFYTSMQQYALTAGAVLGIPPQVILAQWAHESAYGTSDLALRANNFGGIKYTNNADYQSGSYGGYNSLASFVQDYIRVMSLPYYKPVREANGVRASIEAFGKTPYAEDQSYVGKLLSIADITPDYDKSTGNIVSSTLSTIGNVVFSPIALIGVFIFFLVRR